ncbi:MAG: membrane dipeptidase [Erysipelotrichaceae bacterium]|nr:membrane dipeptidase [Erysipelotrichaceae bacterium]
MKIFDMHADIGMDVADKRKQGEHNILQRFHLPKFEAGEVKFINMACFFDGHESLHDALFTLHALREEIDMNQDKIHLCLDGSFVEDKLNVIMSIEGMGFLKEGDDALGFIDTMHSMGVRLASLSWNDQNMLSTGISGDPRRGLTPLGQEVIQKMVKKKIIVDVSHANEKSFYDISDVCKTAFMATHSNTREKQNVERNLTHQQLKAIANSGGLIGLVAVKKFISSNPNRQNALELAQHAKAMKEVVGVDHLCIGFDYMDFLKEPFGPHSMAVDLQDATMSQNLIQALATVGFTQEEVEKIAYKNAMAFVSQQLK